ncbi:MAG: hypothetical protein WAX69_14460 [Victivallales bacterium]
MAESPMNRNTYLSKNVGSFEDAIEIRGRRYRKVEDLRYGTNPHQPAAYYKPEGETCTVGDMQILKTGKSGLSQTNLEDISYALNIVKYFDKPACAVMKHVNPSGAAVQRGDETICDVYKKARDCDARAAFGSVIAFNVELDAQTATEIMNTFCECVVAPAFDKDAVMIFNDGEKFKLNKQIRIIKCGNISAIPRYVGESSDVHNTLKVLADGSVVVAAPLLTNLRSVADLKPASAESKTLGTVVSTVKAMPGQIEDILAAWYINLSVRSNGVVIMKNGQTLSVGTGEQDRVGAVEQAVWKYNNKYQGDENIKDAVMASDGFFPFPDAVEVAAEAGVSAMISPPGSIKDADVIKRANELGVALFHAPERCFSHH